MFRFTHPRRLLAAVGLLAVSVPTDATAQEFPSGEGELVGRQILKIAGRSCRNSNIALKYGFELAPDGWFVWNGIREGVALPGRRRTFSLAFTPESDAAQRARWAQIAAGACNDEVVNPEIDYRKFHFKVNKRENRSRILLRASSRLVTSRRPATSRLTIRMNGTWERD